MAIAGPFNQTVANGGTASSYSFTVPAPTNGNCLVICDVGNNATTVITGVSQTGATWQQLVVNTVSRQAAIWYAMNVSGAGTTVTITLSTAPTISNDVNYTEWSGVAISSAAGATNANSGAGNTDTGTITPTSGRNALLLSCVRAGGAVSGGPDAGWTALTSPDSSSRAFMAYQLVASVSGGYSNHYTNSGGFGCVIGSLLAPAPGGGATFGNFYPGGSGSRMYGEQH